MTDAETLRLRLAAQYVIDMHPAGEATVDHKSIQRLCEALGGHQEVTDAERVIEAARAHRAHHLDFCFVCHVRGCPCDECEQLEQEMDAALAALEQQT